jgi:hypothetical protein
MRPSDRRNAVHAQWFGSGIGSTDGRKFLEKNYPRVCLLEDTTRFAPGPPRYLLVYAFSKNDFVGFQPIRQTTQGSVSGSGTVTSTAGNMWNFTYTGTTQMTDTVQVPYVVDSQKVFLNAYGTDGIDRRGPLKQRNLSTKD